MMHSPLVQQAPALAQLGPGLGANRKHHRHAGLIAQLTLVASVAVHGVALAALGRTAPPHLAAPLSLIAIDVEKPAAVIEAPKPVEPPAPAVEAPKVKAVVAPPPAPVVVKSPPPPAAEPPPEPPPPAPAILTAPNGSDANAAPAGVGTFSGWTGGTGTAMVTAPPQPPPAPPPPPRPIAKGDDGMGAYLRAIRQRVASAVLSMDGLVRDEHRGTVQVQIVLGADGALRGTSVVGGNGDATCRAAALVAVRKAGRFPPLPPVAAAEGLAAFTIPLNFGL